MNLLEFCASDGWFRNWRRRNGIGRSVRLWGEAGDHTEAEFTEPMTELRESLEDFRRENTFNMDETGLFFKTIPATTYLGLDESRRTVRGTKSLKAKDRVTLLLCVNATGNFVKFQYKIATLNLITTILKLGTCKIPPLIIGTAKKPNCFENANMPVPYFNQRCAWVDKVMYRRWWNEVFVPAIREWTDEPVALLMDNFSGHDEFCVDPTGQVIQDQKIQ